MWELFWAENFWWISWITLSLANLDSPKNLLVKFVRDYILDKFYWLWRWSKISLSEKLVLVKITILFRLNEKKKTCNLYWFQSIYKIKFPLFDQFEKNKYKQTLLTFAKYSLKKFVTSMFIFWQIKESLHKPYLVFP